MEAGYQSAEFAEYCHSLSYRIETSPTRDKHAHSIAERSVGNIVIKANVAMLGNINNLCPRQSWPDVIEYACHSDGFGFKDKSGTSPYFNVMFISSIYVRSGRLYISLSHPMNASAVSSELLAYDGLWLAIM